MSVCVGILSDVFRDGVTEETRSGGGASGLLLKRALCDLLILPSLACSTGHLCPFSLGM